MYVLHPPYSLKRACVRNTVWWEVGGGLRRKKEVDGCALVAQHLACARRNCAAEPEPEAITQKMQPHRMMT